MFKKAICGVALSLGMLSSAHAILQINFMGLDIEYDAGVGAFYDGGGAAGGNGNLAQADRLLFMTISDGVTTAFLPNPFSLVEGPNNPAIDFLLPVNPISADSGFPLEITGNGAGFFDFLLGSPVNGFGLEIDNVSWVSGEIGPTGTTIAVSGSVGSVGDQVDLTSLGVVAPSLGDSVLITFSAQNFVGSTFDPDGAGPGGLFYQTINATATGEASVPEPGVLALLGIGLVAAGVARRKARRKA